jgi:DNA helicase-2/ATP-dependent DNA helicase PcrA
VIVAAGDDPPPRWRDCPRVRLDDAALARPGALIASLNASWMDRAAVVVEVGTDPERFRRPEDDPSPVHGLDPALVLASDRLHFLVWANNYDARSGDPVWWWSRKARAVGAAAGIEGGPDVSLPDGTPAWVDGGPRWSVPRLAEPIVHSESVEAGGLSTVPAGGDPDAELAPDQLAAVTHGGGPVRVIAPAGSGKTRVLTERLRHLLADRGYDRAGVLAVAYNKEAQRELESRLAGLEPRTRTLNALGYHVLAEHRGERPPVLDERDVRGIVDEVFPVPRRMANTDPVGPYLDGLTQIRLGLIDPETVEADRDDVPGLADRFDAYRERLLATGSIDFDEQVYGSIEALMRDGEFRRRMQPSHRHLLVDEFQDLTPAHVLLLRLLAMPQLDVFGVGDDDQTIYDHAGANPRFLVDFGGFFPHAGSVALKVNYRCPVATVEAASSLLAYNEVRVAKAIRPGPAADAEPGALRVLTSPPDAGASSLVEIVGEWLAEPEVESRGIAVLARVNSLLLAPQVALQAAGVPVHSVLRPDVVERTGIAAALAWLRVALEPDALLPGDLETIRRRPSRGFPNWISKWFSRCRSLNGLRGISAKIDDERVAGKVEELADAIELAGRAAAEGADTRGLLELIRDGIGLGGAMDLLDGSKGNQGAASHLDDLEALLGVADLHPDPAGFEPWLRESLARPATEGGVTLSTVHRVKGREWDRVAVFGVTAGILPHRLAEDAEGERRVLHVAITRARHRCAVLGDAERVSPFLDELRGSAERAFRQPSHEVAVKASGRRNAAARSAMAAPLSPQGEAADRALREWRSERSRRDGVPAYVVLANKHIAGIATAMPGDAAELRACDGIGPAKLERYGDEILAVLDSVRDAAPA